MPTALSNLVGLLQQRAEECPDHSAYTFLSGDDLRPSELTYRQLDFQARTIAAFLQASGLQRQCVLLAYPPGLEFISALFGCFYAGVIAVPAYPPRMNRNALRVVSIAEDSQARLALTTAGSTARLGAITTHAPELGKMRWVAADNLEPALADDWREFSPDEEDLAYLQYTSGSTATPRGVMITHANLLHNSAYIAEGFGHTPQSVSLCWLPHFHDMGLIDGILQPLYSGFPGYLMSPAAFLQQPVRWLEAISRYRVTHSGGPNFAYDLCSAKISAEQRERLDLTSWQVAYNGAEPVHARTIEQFVSQFGPCGFRRSAFYPAYGLAEATLKVSGGKRGAGPAYCTVKTTALEQNRIEAAQADDPEGRALVGAGHPGHDVKVAIVEPQSHTECAAGQVGEIWVRGPNVAAGYWNQPKKTKQVFAAILRSSGEGPFLRTGDLGFMRDGELFVTGRIKDLIIIRGRNHYPHDIEGTVQLSNPILRGMTGAAFSINIGTEERLTVAQEIDPRRSSLFAQVIADIRQAIAEEHEIEPYAILLLKRGTVPKTSSGKIERRLCQQNVLQNGFKALAEWRDSGPKPENVEVTVPLELTSDSLQMWLRNIFAAKLRRNVSAIGLHQPVVQLGFDSLAALEISHRIESALGVNLSQSLFLEGWSIAQIADHILKQGNEENHGDTETRRYTEKNQPYLTAEDAKDAEKQLFRLGDLAGREQVIERQAGNLREKRKTEASNQNPLSQGQQALWFLQQFAPESRAYYIARALRLKNEIDVVALRAAFQMLIDRHDALRTVFSLVNGTPVQHVEEQVTVSFTHEDASHWDSTTLQQRLTDAANQRFDLGAGPLFRAFLFSRSACDHLLVLAVHHIVADLWSLGLLLNELSEIYTAKSRGIPAELPPVFASYANYVDWEEKLLQADEGERHWQYWHRQLGGDLPSLDLPVDFQRPLVQTYKGAAKFTKFDAALLHKLKSTASNYNTTLYTLLIGLFEAFLHRYTGQEDVLAGTPTAGRSRLEFAGTVGYFVNPVVIRMDFSGNPSFENTIIQARRTVLEALQHQVFPFATLVQRLQPQRDPSRSPLFQAMFILQKTSLLADENLAALALGAAGAEMRLGGLILEAAPLEQSIAQFDLTLAVAETSNGMAASFEYNTDLFEDATIERMMRHFERLAQGCMAHPLQPITEISLLADEERRQVLAEWNQTEREYPAHQTVIELLDAQARKTPQNPAVSFEGKSLSYAELHQRANQLAHYLMKLGVGPETPVGVCMERSEQLVIVLLGILKAGGAYVPLDPSYPAERLNYILNDAQVRVLLGSAKVSEKLKNVGTQTRLVCLDESISLFALSSLSKDSSPQARAPALHANVTGENLAYLIYTSGSTGQPKGVMSIHRGLVNRLQWMQEAYGLNESDLVLQKTAFGFDVSVWEFFWPLMYGACLVVARPEGHKDSRYLSQTIQQEQITTLHFVPSMLQVFLQEPEVEACTSLRRVICSGEALPVQLAQDFHKRLRAELHNLYGPTEASIDVSFWACSRQPEPRTSIPIGRPIANTQLYILDTHLQPVPVGLNGELYIGGVGLARGYWQRADLTAEKFIPDPFSATAGERLYRTGDRARRRADGTIEFLGRNDFQIKIRGFRIELGEIEARLAEHSAVRECVVAAREDTSGNKRLIAYYTLNTSDRDPGAEALRRYLAAHLPEYMVPSAYVRLESLPLTANGKLDRKALPLPKSDAYATRAYEAPLGEAETILAGIWAEVLGVERVGRHDNFFALGGHSLLAMTLIERMRRNGLSADVQTVFTTHSLAELAAVAGRETGSVEIPPNLIPLNCEVITPEMLPLIALNSGEITRIGDSVPGGAANVQDIYPLAPLQEGIFFHHLMSQESDAYISFVLLSFDDRGRLDSYVKALQAVIDRHDILRTCVLWEGLPEPVQVVQRKVVLAVEEVKLDAVAGDASQQLYERFHPRRSRMDIRQAPLLQIYIAHDAVHDRWLMVKLAHHFIDDNTSLRMMFQEIRAHLTGRADQLPAPLPFRNFVAQARLGTRREEHEAFFRHMLGDVDEPTAPFGMLEALGDGTDIEDAHSQLSTALAQRVRRTARTLGVNAASLFHLAWALVLARVSGREDVVFGTVLFGRMHSGAYADNALGLFINTLPVRIQVREESVETAVRRAHVLLADLMRHEHASLALAQRCSAISAPTPLFTALLNYRHSKIQLSLEEEVRTWEGIEWLHSEERTNYPFTLSIDDLEEGFQLTAQTPASIGPMRLCEFMNTAMESLLEALENAPHAAVRTLDVLTHAEREQLLVEWNRTDREYPREQCIQQLFEEQVRSAPQNIAVVFQDQKLSYETLNARANQLAHYLSRLGVGPEARVAICMERSLQMVVALLGVLKAGGAYVPLDPEYPQERLQFMMEDAQPKVLLTERRLQKLWSTRGPQVICIEEIWERTATVCVAENDSDLSVAVHPANAAYVIYTSGSTGCPKGVIVTHGNLARLMEQTHLWFGFSKQDVWTLFHSYAFDFSVWELWGALLYGGRLVVVPYRVSRSPEDFLDLLVNEQVTVLNQTPSAFQQLMRAEEAQANSKSLSLRLVIFGGEALEFRSLQGWLKRHPEQPQLVNMYGITETTVHVTYQPIQLADVNDKVSRSSIGVPITDLKVYVLDDQMRPAPVGIKGELYIGGAGVARGYLNRPEWTAERFVPNLFSERAGERSYRSGDEVRWRRDGVLEFVGRKDRQVKVRGYRIELGEIEWILRQHEAVREAVVTVQEKDRGENTLIAHVVMADEKKLDGRELRQYLQDRLPSYMVPSAFMQLEEIPLTPSGKINRQALKKWEFIPGSDQQAPRTETEAALAEIWKQLFRLERVGVHDSFFELGGDSIISLQVMARAQQKGIRITPRQLFESPTIAELAAVAGQVETAGQSAREESAPAHYPLSPTQQGILFECLSAPETTAYVQQLTCTLRGGLDVEAFQAAWQQVVERQPILRTGFIWDGRENPIQEVRPKAALPFEYQDWTGMPLREQQQQFQSLLEADRAHGFTLSEAPLLRIFLLQMGQDVYRLLFTFHHLILDGWSLPLLFREVFEMYGEQIGAGRFHAAPVHPYYDYIRWLQVQDLSSAETYWQQTLHGFTAPTPIPFSAPSYTNKSGKLFSEQQIQFSSQETAQLQSAARQHGTTLSILVQAAWALLLSRYSREPEIVFGLTLSGRSADVPSIETMIGLFINTLPVRAQVEPEQPLRAWLKELHTRQIELTQYEHTPLSQVQKWSEAPAGTRLFESIVVFENYPLDASLLLQQTNRFTLEDVEAVEITNYPLTVTAVPHSDLRLLISYDRRRFDDGAITRMIGHMQTILLSMAAAPHQSIRKIPWLTPAEHSQLLVDWNQTAIEQPPEECAHNIFEQQVKRTPENIAVTFGDCQIIYAELDQRANQLANYLRRLGVVPETYIGLCVERSLEMVVGILGIFKAGGVYTPVDPSWPSRRKAFVIKETQAPVLLTSKRLLAGLPAFETKIICLDSDWEQISAEQTCSRAVQMSPDNLAYVIHTSGTTGKPKGVLISHGALCNHLRWMQAAFPLTAHDRVPQKYSLSFDVSVLEIFYPLLAGARLAVAPPMEYFDSASLMDFLIENRITTIDLVPSMLRALIDDQRFPQLTELRQVTCGGDVLSGDLRKKFFACSTAELANLYGPTEATIGATFSQCRRDDKHLPLPIGRPVSNTEIYILDQQMEPVPVGVAGEIYIGGMGLARGYLHEPGLTADKFVPHGYSRVPGERLYRTGDLGRYRADGNIEYLGRTDHQVKIRGYRIEPGEIEVVLRAYPAVRNAVVVAHEQHLVAYLSGAQRDHNDLRQYLKKSLPEYMLPTQFVWLEKLPMLANGKVDRKALPAAEMARATLPRAYVAPRNDIEAALAAVWSAVLKVEQVGVEDNFFDLGGDSIISLQVVARAQQQGIRITPHQLFECRTIAALATVAERMEDEHEKSGEQNTVAGEVALTPIQQWFFEQEFEQAHHYNQAVLLQADEELNSEWLEAAWKKLVEHHDALRLRYTREAGEWRQGYAAREENRFFHVVELKGSDEEQSKPLDHVIEEMQQGLNLEQGPLLRVAHVKPDRIAVVVHHLAVDGVSWRILLEDLESAYRQLGRGEEIILPAKTASYQKWAEIQAREAQAGRYEEELEYWLRIENEQTEKIPRDWEGGKNLEENRECVKVELGGEQTRQLLQEVPGVYHTQINDVLLAAVLSTWENWTGKQRLLIDVEGHGRTGTGEGLDVSRTVGWFTAVYPVRLEADGEDGIGERLKAVKEQLRQVPGQGIGFGVLRYIYKDRDNDKTIWSAAALGCGEESPQAHKILNNTRDRLARQPAAEISFNYLGQLDAALPEKGLFRKVEPLEASSRGARNQRSHLLEIEARVLNGRLEVEWLYNRETHRRETIERLARNFIKELDEIIRHCLAADAGGFTPSDFPLARVDQRTLDLLVNGDRAIADIYPLSPIQQGLLFHTLYDGPHSGTYVEQLSCTLEGNVNLQAFERAWQQTIDGHPVLRTSFIWEGLKEPLQVVHQPMKARLICHDWRQSPVDQQQRLEELRHADIEQGFALSRAPLMRLTMIQLGPASFEFIWTSHHLLLDGWSMALVLQEVLERYAALCAGTSIYPARYRPYRDYIAWIRKQDLVRAQVHWESLLEGFSGATPLPGERLFPSAAKEKHSERQLTLAHDSTIHVQGVARQQQVTLSVLVQAAWAFLLRHYTARKDLLFGVTVSGRPAELAEVDRMVGVFINTLPLRLSLPSAATVASILKELQSRQLQLDEYAYTPLASIQEWSQIPPGLPLFETAVVFENYPVDASLKEPAGTLKFSNVRSKAGTNYPLALIVKPGNELALQLIYDAHRFESGMIVQLLNHLRNLLASMAADPMQRVTDLQLMSNAERQQLLMEWNQTAREYPREHCIQQLFEEQARRTPQNIAVVFQDQKLSYAELNSRANQLAHYLSRAGVGAEVRVGLFMERSLEMIVGLLAILKAGGVYVALDASSPRERLELMLAESRIMAVLTQQRLRERLPEPSPVQLVCMDRDAEWEKIARESSENLEVIISSEQLAYISYTSGSTGKPKGVSVPHRAVARLVKENDYARLGAEEVMLQMAPLAFDASTLEIWGSLLNGGRLVVMAPGPQSAEEIGQTLVDCEVTTLWLTAGLFHVMVDEQLDKLKQVRQVLAGGDVLSVAHVNLYLEAMREDGVLINGYGPTENTTFTCCHPMKRGESIEGIVPIGRPIGNTQVYVLNEEMQPVPVGVMGELYIAGEGLARGYENDAALTADKFVPHPNSVWSAGAFACGDKSSCPDTSSSNRSAEGQRLYRSGDEVRWREDGVLEFIGRKDRQVKVRGYRIELGEIEWTLTQHEGVREAVVTVQQKTGEKALVAYVVMQPDQAFSIPDLQRYLKSKLPDYMVPGIFMPLEKLPLTPNGKVDLKALPQPETPEVSGGVVLPRTPVEQGIAEIWRQVFGREKLSIHDNFFHLGGHSLLALQIASRVRTVLRAALPLRSVFEEPTIAGQARAVEKLLGSGKAAASAGIRPVARPDNLPLSFAQQRLWFLQQLELASDFYNVPLALRIGGPLDAQVLRDCCTEILRRHEALRTTFPIRQGTPVQQISDASAPPIEVRDLGHLSLEAAEATAQELLSREAQRPFDLSRGPLLRLFLLRLAEDDHVLLLNMHHIIVDGWSVGIFMQELAVLYETFFSGRSSPLSPLPVQYADYAVWQREWLSEELLETELAYWRKQLSGTSASELPADHPRPKVQTFHGAKKSILLSPQLLESLRELAHRENSTVFMTLLAGLKALIYRYTGQPDITVGTPVAGRNQQEIERLIGFFVNTLVLRTTLLGQPRFTEFLRQVREVSLGAYAHQELPFEKLVEELHSQRDPGRTPFFQVMFALEETLSEELVLPGLQISPIELATQTAKFDLMLAIRETSRGLPVSFQYNTDLFEDATIERMMRHFERLLCGIAANPAQRIAEIPLLADQERQQVLAEWNQTAREYPAHQTVLELLEAQARKTPQNSAVRFEGRTLSYRDLHQQANQLARYLKKLGVGPEIPVGICMERSEHLVIALLGILKAGGAYVPLDPSYPAERLNYILHDAQAGLLLASAEISEKLKDAKAQARLVCLEETLWSAASGCNEQSEWNAAAEEKSVKKTVWSAGAPACGEGSLPIKESSRNDSPENPEINITGENLAYLIYTSGSTGQPKGVMSIHRGLLNRLQWMQEAYGLNESDRVLQKTPFGFDVSVWEFFWPLMYGACLVVARPEGHKDSRYLVQTIQQEQITTLHFVPSMLQVFLQEPGIEACTSLRRVICSGEALPAQSVQEFHKRLQAELHNLYGPTEASIDVSFWACDRQPEKRSSVPIGRPIANTQLYILDDHLQPVPPGVSGELHIGGVGLARGYWQRAELTAEKFIPGPFSSRAGERLYRTGDLARWRADGTIEYLGRLDNQVKLRGYRIELGEIEAVLGQHPEVSQAVVTLKDDGPGEKRLIACVVAKAGTDDFLAANLREYLKEKLPEYMVPAVVQMDQIPLTVNGKIDYNVLPSVSSVDLSATHSYVAPRNAVEEQIAKKCCDLLGIQRMGIHDNFFDLGGHSLVAMRLMTWVHETLQAEAVPLRGFFETPTIAGLAALTVACEVRPGQTEKIAKFLQQLDAMSPEELMTFRTKYMASEAAHNAVSKQ